MWEVLESKLCRKQMKKCPKEILQQYQAWVDVVSTSGPSALRQILGYRDHALKGEWKGARSSYLSLQWRVLYVIERKELHILVLEVNPHEY